ncbi:MAG: TolC family protein [Deltaproteobacteria bacterium]|nr:TolC family protein [Deltaproteobacteria bacterium]
MDSVDLPQAVARALKANPAVSAEGHDLAAARHDVLAARGRYLPELSAGLQFLRTDVPAEVFALKINQEKLSASDFLDVNNFNNPPPLNGYFTTFTLRQPIFAPQAYLGYKMARKEAGAKEFDYSRTREEAVYKVLAAYLDVLTAKAYAGVAAQGFSDAKEHRRLAEAAEKAGTGLSADVLRTKVSVAAAEGEMVTAESRLELARRGLSLAMGEKNAPPTDALGPPPAFPPPETLEELQAAVERRTDLRAASMRVANAATGETLRKSEYLPTLGFIGEYRLDAANGPFSVDNRSWKAGVGLSWNVFDGLRREAAVSRAASERRKAEENYRGEKDLASFQVAQAYLEVRDAQRRAEIAGAAVAAAEEGARLIRSRYENQIGRMIDVLDAQAALDRARAEAVKAENDVRRSHARLMFASGTLLEWAFREGKEARQ